MGKEHRDRRVGRTRRAAHEALHSLILEKGYDRVTVRDVIDRADIGRATFYAHFQGKDDLLISGLAEMREFLRGRVATAVQAEDDRSGSRLGFTRALFKHAVDHRREYRVLNGSPAGRTMWKRVNKELTSLLLECLKLNDTVTRRRREPVVPIEIIEQYVVGAFLAVLTWWLDHGGPYTAEQMGDMFERLTRPVVGAAFGVSSEHADRTR